MKALTVLIHYLLVIITLNVFITHSALAIEEGESSKVEEPLSIELSVDDNVLAFLKLAKSNSAISTDLVTILQKNIPEFNPAENYLYLLGQAIIASKKEQFTEAVKCLVKANDLDRNVPETQLNQPLFSYSHLVLADSYAELKQYDLAFLEKREYLKKFYAFSNSQRKNTIALLTNKHELTHKNEENELLKNENQLKALQISKILHQEKNHQYTVIFTILVMVVFILLFLRQLIIRKKLLKLARIDVLTGLANRIVLFERGEKLVNQSVAENAELSALLLDIDDLKAINDNFGHQIGDEVLKIIAQLGCEAMRSRDLFARLGGEEFVALLPKTGQAEAKAIAQRMKEKIARYQFKHLGIEDSITISVGIVSLHQVDNSFERLLHAADSAMYQAKTHGKNTVVNYCHRENQQERRSR